MIEAKNLIKDGKFLISASQWLLLNELHSKSYIKSIISKAIDEYSLDVPTRQPTEEEAAEDAANLQKLDPEQYFLKNKPFSTKNSTVLNGKMSSISIVVPDIGYTA